MGVMGVVGVCVGVDAVSIEEEFGVSWIGMVGVAKGSEYLLIVDSDFSDSISTTSMYISLTYTVH